MTTCSDLSYWLARDGEIFGTTVAASMMLNSGGTKKDMQS